MAGPAKSSLSEWQDGLTRAVGDAKWHAWDCEIQAAVNDYNRHLSGTAGYLSLDWRTIKAIVWIETGANHPQWHIKPMQIGVQGDPGLRSLLSGNEGGDLIIPPAWKGRLTTSSATTLPSHNIRAGIGYLLMRMANYEYRSVIDRDAKVYEVKVAPGDTLDKIARRNGSTTAVLKTLNPAAEVLRPGQILKYQKAAVRRIITGWRPLSAMSVAVRYNSMRSDVNYAKKLEHAIGLVNSTQGALCAP